MSRTFLSMARKTLLGVTTALFVLHQVELQAETDHPNSTKALEVEKVTQIIDREITQKLKDQNLQSNPLTSDAEFMRRVYLDVTGCTPNQTEAQAFLSSQDPHKRAQLIDTLLQDEGFGTQQGRVWRDWIAPQELPSEGNGGNQPIQATRNLGKWFADQFNQNKPWNQIVHEVVTVDGQLKDKPQGLFYSLTGTDTGIPEPAGATRAITSLFLGLDLQCAQCHDDPYKEWKQTDFWAQAAFFKNVQSNFNGRYFAAVTETFGKPTGKGAKKITTRDRSNNGLITIPKDSFENAGKVVEMTYLLSEKIQVEAKQPLRPILSEWLTSKDNPYFAKAFVNRTWSYFFARGIVEPIDDMRPSNKPSHPKVLEVLTQEFIQSKFDVKHLVRLILNTDAYQRSSLSIEKEDKKLRESFGRYPVKVLSTDQLYDSLRQALQDPKLDLRTYDKKALRRFGESSPVGDEYTEFQRLFETDENDSTHFTHGIPQFLALLNHPQVSSGGPKVDKLIKAKTEPQQAVNELYFETLSRPPSPDELDEALEYIQEDPDNKRTYSGVLWMLLNRSEFMLVR